MLILTPTKPSYSKNQERPTNIRMLSTRIKGKAIPSLTTSVCPFLRAKAFTQLQTGASRTQLCGWRNVGEHCIRRGDKEARIGQLLDPRCSLTHLENFQKIFSFPGRACASLPLHGPSWNWSSTRVGFCLLSCSKKSCLAVGTALRLGYFPLLFQLLGVVGESCFQLRVWRPPFPSGPADGIELSTPVSLLISNTPLSGEEAVLNPFKDAHCSS